MWIIGDYFIHKWKYPHSKWQKIFLADDLVENKKCWKINFELGSLDQSFLNDLIQNKHFQSKNELAPIPKNLSHDEDKKKTEGNWFIESFKVNGLLATGWSKPLKLDGHVSNLR